MHDLLSFTWNFQVSDNLVPRAILNFTTIFINPWKNEKYLLINNLFPPLLQMKLFWRNNIAFTKKCIIYLLVLYLKLTFPNFTRQLNNFTTQVNCRTINFMHIIFIAAVRLGSEAAVCRGSEKYVWWEKTWKISAENFIFQLGCSLQVSNVDKNELVHWYFSMILTGNPS